MKSKLPGNDSPPANYSRPTQRAVSSIKPTLFAIFFYCLGIIFVLSYRFNIFCLLFLLGLLWSLRELWFSIKLRQTGLTAPGVIVELLKVPTRGIHYRFAYHFTVSGKTFGAYQEIDKSKYDTLHVGDTVTVRYLPTDPTKSRVEF